MCRGRQTRVFEFVSDVQIHDLEVSCMLLLQNGNILTGSLDTTLRIWDPVSFEVLSVFEGHTHRILKAIELCDGNIASISQDQTINVWDRQTGDILNTLEGFEDPLADIQEVNQDCVALLCQGDDTLLIWHYKKEINDNLANLEGHEGEITKFCVFGGKFIYTGATDKLIKKWNPLEPPNETSSLKGHSQAISELVVLDKKHLASGSLDNSVKIWEVSTNFCLYTLEGHTKPISKISFIGDMKILLSCSKDKTIRVWNLDSHKCLSVLQNEDECEDLILIQTASGMKLGNAPESKANAQASRYENEFDVQYTLSDESEDENLHGLKIVPDV